MSNETDRFMLVPGAPCINVRATPAQGDGRIFFSFARHAMIGFLAFLGHTKGLAKINLLSPVYMCHEVIAALRPHTSGITFFEQGENLDFDLAAIESQCKRENINVLLVSHLYGKRLAIKPLRELCDSLDIILLEDSAHLPPFVLDDTPQCSHAQFFTDRKLFAVPYGASIRVCPEWRIEFGAYCKTHIAQITKPFAGLDYCKWLLRDAAKNVIRLSGIPWRRSYAELGIDPLPPFNAVPAILETHLHQLNGSRFVETRKKNYALLREGVLQQKPDWYVLECGNAPDVPYQFLLYRKGKTELAPLLTQFLQAGVGAVKGLELLPETRKLLGSDHPFNNQIALPLHQSVTPGQIEHMLRACQAFLK
jgi:hypothetical protein